MKKIVLIITLFSTLTTFSQNLDGEWSFALGLNAINSLGTKSPINSPDEWAFKTPISLAAEYEWTPYYALELALSTNGFNEDKRFDPAPAPEDFTYFSIDTNVKHYLGQYFFRRSYWIDFYASAGLGFFTIDESNISFNFGSGVLFWVNKDQTFGIRAQINGKFAFNNRNSGFDNNHYQYHLQGVLRL